MKMRFPVVLDHSSQGWASQLAGTALQETKRFVRRKCTPLANLCNIITVRCDGLAKPGLATGAASLSTPEALDSEKVKLPGELPQTEMIFRFPAPQRHLPPGVPTWGIARAHRYLKRVRGVQDVNGNPWRDAARFEDEDTNSHALILASEGTKEVRLQVAADYPPYFLGVMESILRDTFKRYPGAPPECLLPCPCTPGCKGTYLRPTVGELR